MKSDFESGFLAIAQAIASVDENLDKFGPELKREIKGSLGKYQLSSQKIDNSRKWIS